MPVFDRFRFVFPGDGPDLIVAEYGFGIDAQRTKLTVPEYDSPEMVDFLEDFPQFFVTFRECGCTGKLIAEGLGFSQEPVQMRWGVRVGAMVPVTRSDDEHDGQEEVA